MRWWWTLTGVHTPNKRHFVMLVHYEPLGERRFFYQSLSFHLISGCNFAVLLYIFIWFSLVDRVSSIKIVRRCESWLDRWFWLSSMIHLKFSVPNLKSNYHYRTERYIAWAMPFNPLNTFAYILKMSIFHSRSKPYDFVT